MVVSQALSLVADLRLKVHPEQLRRLQHIDEENFEGVRRKVREHALEIGDAPSEADLDRGVFGLKQYYAVALLDPANAHAVSAPLDPFWHAHILHTEQYIPFCEKVVGEYMHHRPLDHGVRAHVDAVRCLYEYTLEILPKIFLTVDSNTWPAHPSDEEIICYHGGRITLYPDVQPYRLFEPNSMAAGY